VWHVRVDIFAKLSFGDRATGLLAVAEYPDRSLAELELPANPLIAVLVGIEKPGNLGAIARSADAAGCSALVVADRTTDLFNPAAIRASLGTIFALPTCTATSEETIRWLHAHDIRIHAACVGGQRFYTEADFTGRSAIVLGTESEGLSAEWSGGEISPIALPMHGSADSLNVSATAAVLFYEALRQRTV